MRYIKDINKFDLVSESVDIYDFGIKTDNFDSFFNDCTRITQPFPIKAFRELMEKTSDYGFRNHNALGSVGPGSLGEYYVKVEILGADKRAYYVIHYYGDYCYGIFRRKLKSASLYGGYKFDWVELCDDIDPVIKRLNKIKEELK
jgi:hypothetical protein